MRAVGDRLRAGADLSPGRLADVRRGRDPRTMRFPTCLLPLALSSACSGACSGAATDADARDAVLLEWLQRDNAIWLSRPPELLAGKYTRMAADPYDFMRGTAGLFHQDLQRLSLERTDLGYVQTSDSASVLIVGDPHPENLSTFLPLDAPGPVPGEPPPVLTVAWADMDAAAYGPWLADVRRASQGLLLFVEPFEGCDAACETAVVQSLARGYDQGVRAVADGGATVQLEGDLSGNPFVVDLLDEAREEGAERKRLSGNTEETEDGRRFEILEALPESGRGLLAPSGAEQAIIDRVLAAYAQQRGGPLRVLDVARRYGQGVSSWPATRFVVLWDTGEDGTEDDRLLNAREILDPPAFAGPGGPASAPWRDNADRLLDTSRTFWPQPDLDPRLGTVQDGNASFKLLSWTSWYQGLDHGKAEDVWDDGADQDDLNALARGIGASLAFAHCRGTTAAGEPACAVILDDLGDDPEALGAALLQVAFTDRDRCLEDHARFTRLLEAHGPLLGAETYAEVSP